jgi:RNA polymerase sigma-70 factor (ECF subfamily)
MLKSAKRKREQYVGEWLPEPFLTSEDDGIAAVERDDLLSYGMLVLLERLTASERVVFVLREALGFEYREIAEMMDKGEANCRKLFSRASAKLAPLTEGEAIRQPQAGSEQWIEQFLSALKQGNMERLLTVLDREVVCVSDGGGKAQVAPRPIATSDRVARFLLGATRKTWTFHGEVAAELASMNGQPAVLFRSADGAVDTVGLFHVEEGAIRKVYFVRNPDKLKHVD